MNPRIGSLFSGMGALDLAVIDTLGGGQVVWHSDTKPASIKLLAHRYPSVPNLGDMTATDYATAEPTDVLAASWPCQPHSSAGKRLGEKDPRALWPHVHRAIAETRPALFFGENVARIAGNGELRRVVRSLAQLGYVGAWRCVRASDVGACHRRDRCFVVAVDTAAADPRFLRSEGTRTPEPTTGLRRHPGHEDRAPRPLTLLPTPTADPRRSRATSPAVAQSRLDSGRRNVDDAVAAHANTDRWGVYADAIERHERVFGRPAPESTQISPRTGKPHLAPAFVEWMMMLPAGHVTGLPGPMHPHNLTRSHQLSLLGDGVVPAQAAYAFRFLLAHLTERLTSGRAA